MSGSSYLDGIAAKLQATASDVLSKGNKATATDGEGGTDEATQSKREALLNVAQIVKDQAGKGLTSSKEYLSKVVDKVSTYASDASATASTQVADVREKGITQFASAKDAANTKFASVKEAASTHLTGLHENLNKAIAQGQAQGQAQGSASTATETDREIPAETEPLSFPFNFIAWIASFCGGKGTTATSTSKDFSIESLQNAAATLTDSLAEGAQSISRGAEASGTETLQNIKEKVAPAAEAANTA